MKIHTENTHTNWHTWFLLIYFTHKVHIIIILGFRYLVLSCSPSLSVPHTLHSHPLNHTLITLFRCPHTHTHIQHSSARNPHHCQSISHHPHSTPGYWTNGSNSTPTAITKITGCTGIKDDLCVRRKKLSEREKTRRYRKEKQMVRQNRGVMKSTCGERQGELRMTGPDWQEAPAEGKPESAFHRSHTALLCCQHPWFTI